MKRIKVAQNRFLTLFRLESEQGHPTSFELVRSTSHARVLLAVFTPYHWKKAFDAFTIVACMLKTRGLQTKSPTIKRWLNRLDDFSAGNRRFKSRYRKRHAQRTTPINPI